VAQIQFKGKPFVQNHHLLVKYHELVPVKSKSLTKKVSLHDNLIIHGDNLKAPRAPLRDWPELISTFSLTKERHKARLPWSRVRNDH
jgi:hypothetical protein